MANLYAQQQKVTNAFLLLLKNNLVMGKLVTTKFDKEYLNETVAVGDTVKIRRSPEYTVRDGAALSAQDTKVGSVDVKIDKQKGVDVNFTSKELTLDVDDLLENQMMKAKAASLAQQVDADLIGETLEFPHWVGTPGQLVNSASDFFVGVQRAMELGIPMDDLHGILSPADHFALAGSFTSLNVDSTAKLAIEKAKLPMVGGVQPYVSQNVINLLVGTRAASGSSLVNGASQNVTYDSVRTTYTQTLAIDGLTAGHTIKRGEVFTIAGVNAVNPRSKADLGYLQKFVVLADATADGGGAIAALQIANPIITTGAYQTVTAAPADNAAIVWMGTASTAYAQNAIFHRGAIALVGAKLEEPKSGIAAYATDPDTGLSIRTWSQSDISNDTHATRVDILYGVVNVDPRLGVRLSGTA